MKLTFIFFKSKKVNINKHGADNDGCQTVGENPSDTIFTTTTTTTTTTKNC